MRCSPLERPLWSLVAGLLLCACQSQRAGTESAVIPAGGERVFEDRFERADQGPHWSGPRSAYRAQGGWLVAQGAKNRPLWLAPKLPRDAKITFTAKAADEAVDIKAEIFGDGRSQPKAASYTATSYVVILGGWNNTRSIIARMNEHGRDRQSRKEPRAAPNRTYDFTIVRRGNRFSWFLDKSLFLEMDDPSPLAGPGHDHFAFNNWQSKVLFDDLAVYEL